MRSRSDAGFFEIILIAVLMLLFGVTTFTLVSAGGNAYRQVIDKRETDITLRVALSYLTTQLRQNDIEDALLVQETDGYEYLTLRREIDGERYETRVYLDNGWLKESLQPEGAPFDPQSGSPITTLSSFTCRVLGDEASLLLTVTSGEGEKTQTRQTVVSLTAGGSVS